LLSAFGLPKKKEIVMRKNRFVEYTEGIRVRAFLAPLFKLLEAVMELMVPLIVADIIDRGIPEKDAGSIGIRFAFLIAFAVLGFVFAVIAQYFSASVAGKFSCRIRQGLFDHIETLSYRELDQTGNAALLTRMTSDINQIQTGVNLFLRLFLRSPFVVFGALIMAFIVDRELGIIFAVLIPVLFVIVFLVMKITLPRYKEIQNSLDKITRESRENLNGVRVIRAFTAEEKQKADFREKNERYTRLQIAAGKISAIMNPLTFLIVNLAIVALLYFGGIKVNAGRLTDGQVVALYNYINYILVELIKFANLIVTCSRSVASFRRVSALFDVRSSLKFGEPVRVSDDHIAFEHVSFRYYSTGEDVLKDITFRVKKNQTIGIIGGTGAGKSTLVSLLGHHYDPTEGRIVVDGYPADSYRLSSLREKIAVVPQKAVLFEGTIRSNLLWGKQDADEEELYRALEISRSMDIIKSKAKGIDEEVEPEGKNFSGGQKQRLTIARALVAQPEILILDDSSSALDFKTDKELRANLKLLKDTTVLIISQRTSSLMSCDQIIVLDHGEIVDTGTHEDLLNRCPLYREIYRCQFGEEGIGNA